MPIGCPQESPILQVIFPRFDRWYTAFMSSRAYVRVEANPHQEPSDPGMAWYFLNAHCDDNNASDEFEFEGPDDLIVGNSFPDPDRAKMWVAHALNEWAMETDDAINTLLPLGRVSLEVGLPSDDTELRGGGQRLTWASCDSLALVGANCAQRDAQWTLDSSLPAPSIAPPKTRM